MGGSQTGGARFFKLATMAVALTALAVLVGWLLAKMTRTDEADYMLIRIVATMGAAVVIAAIAVFVTRRSRRG